MSRNSNITTNEVKMKLESVANNIKKVERYVKDVLTELKHQNLPQNKSIISDRMLSVLTLIVAFISLLVACFATYSSNKLTTNNSALNFTYENINIKEPDPEEGIPVNTKDIEIAHQGTMELCIDIKVISGQIESLYLVQKRNGKFIFYLLNNEGIQDHFSGTKRYSLKMFLDMEKMAEYENMPIGMGQIYILSVDINGKIKIDTIQIIGHIFQEFKNNKITIYGTDGKYTFRYLKNNKLITLKEKDDVDEGWVNLSNKYLDIMEETDLNKIEKDIVMIKEEYSKY